MPRELPATDGRWQGVIRMSAEERKKPEHVTSPAHIATAKSAASQRRHELVNNTLVNQLNKFVQAFKGGPSRRTWIFGGVVVAAVGLYFVWRFFDNKSKEKSSAGWTRMLFIKPSDRPLASREEKALPPSPEEELAKIEKDHEGAVLARIARFDEARIYLANGQRMLGSPDRPQGLKLVRNAKEKYEKLQSESTDDPVLHLQAILCAAKANEMLGEWSEALKQYGLLMKEHEKGDTKNAFFEEAKAGEDRLKDPKSRKEQEDLNKELNRKYGQ